MPLYKAADLASKLTQAGALVDVIMTEAATQFVTPMTFQAVTQRPVFTGMFHGLAGGTSPAAMNIAHVDAGAPGGVDHHCAGHRQHHCQAELWPGR